MTIKQSHRTPVFCLTQFECPGRGFPLDLQLHLPGPSSPLPQHVGASGETETEDWRRGPGSLRAHRRQRGKAPPLQPRKDLEGPRPPLAAMDVQATLAESEGREGRWLA